MIREGYYVERRFFGSNRAQAEARARHLSAEYGRPVDVMRKLDGRIERVTTVVSRSTAALALAVGL